MKPYKISGSFLMGENWSNFTKEVVGRDEEDAVDRLLSDFGSRHRVKRRNIKISSVEELREEEINDPIVEFMVKRGA